jgi:hypothetical protein
LSFDEGGALFLAYAGPGERTLYFRGQDGAVLRIIGPGDILNGRAVSDIGIAQQSLSGDQLAFYARMSGGFEGIYTVTIPASGGLALGALGVAAGMWRKRG